MTFHEGDFVTFCQFSKMLYEMLLHLTRLVEMDTKVKKKTKVFFSSPVIAQDKLST
jgi:hypothetical protein